MKHILLVSNDDNSNWCVSMQECLIEWGILEIVHEVNVQNFLELNNFDLIIIDTDLISEDILLIKKLQAIRSGTPIIVATSARNWIKARDAFRAGAADYILQSNNKFELNSILREVLHLPPFEDN